MADLCHSVTIPDHSVNIHDQFTECQSFILCMNQWKTHFLDFKHKKTSLECNWKVIEIYRNVFNYDSLLVIEDRVNYKSQFYYFRRMNTRWAFSTWECAMMAGVKFTPTNLHRIYFSMVGLTLFLYISVIFFSSRILYTADS